MLGLYNLQAQHECRTIQLSEIAELLKEHGCSMEVGVHSFEGLKYGYEVRQNGDSVITHIGTPLFSRIMESQQPSNIYNFAERYILFQHLLPLQERINRLRDDKVFIDENLAASVDTTNCTIEIYNESGRGEILWILPDSSSYGFHYPIQFQLLNGMNKIEAEQVFIEDLERYSNTEINISAAPMDSTEVLPLYDFDIFVKEGGSYIIAEMKGDTYYVRDSLDKMIPLHSNSYPNETLSNLSNCLIEGHTKLHIKQRLYGFKKCYYTLEFQTLASFLINQGCKPYIGIEDAPADILRATVIYVNKDMGYDHMLFIETSPETLLDPNGVIEAELSTYIPNNNIKSLFQPNEIIQK